MRFLTADYLYPLYVNPIKKGVLQVSDRGKIINIFNNRAEVPSEKLEIFEGFLCPGFVNAHCHLELSHLLEKTDRGQGFLNFVGAVRQRNDFSKKTIQTAIAIAEKQMISNGIVAVGDICNTSDTLLQKKKRNLKYYNFIETFEVLENKIDDVFYQAMKLRNEFRNIGQQATIVPHSPYSVPPKLMRMIATSFDEKDELFSIHNQETKEENELFSAKSGKFLDWLKSINASSSIWLDRDRSTDILEELENTHTLLVHNTFIKKEEITANYYCTCPKANLYIEDALPDYSIFDINKLCVGTDSLASNNSLSILEELLVIQDNSNFDINTLLKIAAKNGAEALGFATLGTFEKGKTPGINLIQDFEKVIIID